MQILCAITLPKKAKHPINVTRKALQDPILFPASSELASSPLARLRDNSERAPLQKNLWPLLLVKRLDARPANGGFAPAPHIRCSCSAWLLRSQEPKPPSAYPTNHIETTMKNQERNPVFQSTSQPNWENVSSARKTSLNHLLLCGSR